MATGDEDVLLLSWRGCAGSPVARAAWRGSGSASVFVLGEGCGWRRGRGAGRRRRRGAAERAALAPARHRLTRTPGSLSSSFETTSTWMTRCRARAPRSHRTHYFSFLLLQPASSKWGFMQLWTLWSHYDLSKATFVYQCRTLELAWSWQLVSVVSAMRPVLKGIHGWGLVFGCPAVGSLARRH